MRKNDESEFIFPIYGYSPPPDGKIRLDGTEYDTGKDFRTVERYEEYKAAGFNILLTQGSAIYDGEIWETCQAKKTLDMASEAGIQKAIIVDWRLMSLSRVEGGLIGEGKRFASESELDAYVEACMQPYRDHRIFYGIQLRDEPAYTYFRAIGELFRSVRRVRPGTFVQCNLLPLGPLRMMHRQYPNGRNLMDRFKAYLTQFVQETKSGYIMYDHYPIEEKDEFERYYLAGLQIAGEVCKEQGVDFYMVIQSFGMYNQGQPYFRLPTEEEIRYQVNMALGFGLQQLSYFTYWTKQDNDFKNEFYANGQAMITREGEKTDTYFAVQKINAEVQLLAFILRGFRYSESTFFINSFRSYPRMFEIASQGKLKYIEDVSADKEIVLVNELYNGTTDEYLYRIQNATLPAKKEICGAQHVKIVFSERVKSAKAFTRKERKTVSLKDGTYFTELPIGAAEYIIITVRRD